MNIFTQFFSKRDSESIAQGLEHELMKRESDVSRDIFGEIQPGGTREFFCLDENTWIWYEEWVSKTGERKQATTRYLVRPREIVKSQNGGAYHRLTISEAENFQKAVKMYISRIKKTVYFEVLQEKA